MTAQEFAAQLRQQYPGPTSRYKDDNELVSAWMKTNPEDSKLVGGEDGAASFSPVATALRVIPGALAAEGGPTGALIGGGGEGAAQLYEWLTQGTKFRPSQLASTAAISAIPFSGPAKELGPLKAIAEQALKGAGIGGASSVIRNVVEKKQLPSLGELAESTGLGAVLGGGVEGTLGRLASKMKVPDTVVKPAEDEAETVIERVKRGLKMVNTSDFEDEAHNSIPRAKGLSKAAQTAFPSIEKMPEEIRGDITDIMEKYHGFADSRRGVQPVERTQALAERLTVPLNQIKPGTAMSAEELVAHRDILASLMVDRADLAKKITAGNATEGDKAMFSQKNLEATIVLANYRGAKAEAGRALNILKTQARVFELGDQAFLEHVMDLPQFNKSVSEAARLMAEAGEDPAKQLAVMKQFSTRSVGDLATGAYYNSLLSGVKTPLRKTLGDAFNLITNMALPAVTAPVDMLRSAVTGKEREVFAGEMGQQLVGLWAALPKAIENAGFVLKNGFSLHTVQDLASGERSDFDILTHDLPGGFIPNAPTRVLKGVTDFFSTLAQHQELYSNAYAKALKAGLKEPGQIQDFMTKLIAGSGKDSQKLFAEADEYARRATFQDKGGPIVQAILDLKNNTKTNPMIRTAMTFLAPFVRLPGKILQRGLETSPAGFAMNAVQQGGRAGVQGMGRATMGSLALMPFVYLAMNGRLSGNGPSNPAEKEALYDKGWLPNSIKVGDKWVQYHLMQPFSTVMSVVGNAWDAFNSSNRTDKDAESIALQTIAKSVGSVLDQSYLAGLNSFMDAIHDPERFGQRWETQMAQGMVPASGLMRNISQAVDPVIRKPEGVEESMETIVPGMSENVPARLNRFGEPTTRPGGPIERGFLIPEISEEKHDPIGDMLERVGKTLGSPEGRLMNKGKKVTLTRDEQQTIEEAIGMERKTLLSPLLSNKNASKAAVESRLSEASRVVDERAMGMKKRGEPIVLNKLVPNIARKFNKGDYDRLYEAYLEKQKGAEE